MQDVFLGGPQLPELPEAVMPAWHCLNGKESGGIQDGQQPLLTGHALGRGEDW